METKPLAPRYLKALELIEAGNHSYREIARLCTISEQSFYDLIEGSAKDNAGTQAKFSAALNEINRRRDKEIRDLVKKNKKTTHYLIDNWLTDQKRRKKVPGKLMPTLVSVANALAKSTPNVEIGSFSYTKGLSAEDIANEWQRLKGIARSGINRRGVRGLTEGRTGAGPLAEGAGDTAAEEPEDIVLRAEPETDPIPPEQEHD